MKQGNSLPFSEVPVRITAVFLTSIMSAAFLSLRLVRWTKHHDRDGAKARRAQLPPPFGPQTTSLHVAGWKIVSLSKGRGLAAIYIRIFSKPLILVPLVNRQDSHSLIHCLLWLFL
jgi:hypothetical protein